MHQITDSNCYPDINIQPIMSSIAGADQIRVYWNMKTAGELISWLHQCANVSGGYYYEIVSFTTMSRDSWLVCLPGLVLTTLSWTYWINSHRYLLDCFHIWHECWSWCEDSWKTRWALNGHWYRYIIKTATTKNRNKKINLFKPRIFLVSAVLGEVLLI